MLKGNGIDQHLIEIRHNALFSGVHLLGFNVGMISTFQRRVL